MTIGSTSLQTTPRAGPHRIRPYVALGLGILGLGMSAIFVRWAAAPGPVTGFYRLLIGSLVLALPFARRTRRRRIPRRALAFAGLGGLFFALDLAFLNTSINLTSAVNATLLDNTSPLWVGLGTALFFRERLGFRFWLGLLLAFGGAVAILGVDLWVHPTLGWGDALALVAGFFYGMYFLATQRGREDLDSLSTFWLSAITGTIALFAVSLAFGHPLTGYSTTTYLSFLALGVFTQAIGYLSIGYALGHLPASIVAPTMLGEPILTAILAVPLLGETIGVHQIIGGLVVMLGVYTVHRDKRALASPGC